MQLNDRLFWLLEKMSRQPSVKSTTCTSWYFSPKGTAQHAKWYFTENATFRFPAGVLKDLKHMAIDKEVPVNRLVVQAVKALLVKESKR
jgi:predicted RNA-binding protein with PUA-like domain